MSIRAKLLALLLPAIIFFPAKTFAQAAPPLPAPVPSGSAGAINSAPVSELTADARLITVVPGKSVAAEPLQPAEQEQPPVVKRLAKANPQDNKDNKDNSGGRQATAAQPAPSPVKASASAPAIAKPAASTAASTAAKPADSLSGAAPASSAGAAEGRQVAPDTSSASGEPPSVDNAGAAVSSSFINDNTATVVSPGGPDSAAGRTGAPMADMPAAGQPDIPGVGLGSAAGAGIPSSGLLAPIARNVKYFSVTVRKHFQQWLARSGRYMGLMKSILRENYMPEDLVFLALIESGFNPRAYSWAKACGPWQFIKGTAVRYGLRVNSWVDERRDPIKSTQAAAAYLKDLYGTFGSWPLAMASYNAGAGMVERAINRTGGVQDFWKLRKTRYMPSETKDYVPKFIAARMIAENPDSFGFKDLNYDKPFVFDEVQLDHCTDLRTVALCCGVPVDKIKELNPELIRGCTPPGQVYTLRVPKGKKAEFLAAFNSLPRNERYAAPRKVIVKSRYIVRRLTTIRVIARRLGVSAYSLARANRLRIYSRVGRGRRLIVPREKTVIAARIPSHIEIADNAAPADGPSPGKSASGAEGKSGGAQPQAADTPGAGPTVTVAADKSAADPGAVPSANQPVCPAKPALRLGSLLPSPTDANADEAASPSAQPTEKPHHYTPRRTARRSRRTVSRLVVYRVRRGDTLASIARRHHTTVAKLARLNRLGRRRLIRAGQRLRLAAGRIRTTKAVSRRSRHDRRARIRRSRRERLASRRRPGHRKSARVRRYRVRNGDTLWSIARKFGVSRKKLTRANSMHGRHVIRKGQILVIPAA